MNATVGTLSSGHINRVTNGHPIEQHQGAIPEAIQQLGDNIGQLENHLGLLVQRLEGILTPELPCAATELNAKNPRATSATADCLIGLSRRIEVIYTQLASLRHRVDC